jgi:signal recognition particle receptor subunit beta
VGVNEFETGPRYPLHEVAEALALPDDVPLITVDARDGDSAKRALIRITEFALTRLASAQRSA